ncbi:unnamed protein product [Macrosiphum euphorbiae]|uniref:Uncharacterized protein n=1 Tax=Macrosiphum euphorbiae TaxID=13131 RepID=A0AAV0WHW0_9HEMI|nr:unnamed protein product [Macrosiphum euphorbiae]
MSNDISKAQLLVCFKKINAYNYICKKFNKPYKTPNGGIGNLKTHYATHLQDVSDKVVPGKRKSQTVLPFPSDTYVVECLPTSPTLNSPTPHFADYFLHVPNLPIPNSPNINII